MSMPIREYVPPRVYSSVDMSLRGYVPPCMCSQAYAPLCVPVCICILRACVLQSPPTLYTLSVDCGGDGGQAKEQAGWPKAWE